jgi:hypothetical protein
LVLVFIFTGSAWAELPDGWNHCSINSQFGSSGDVSISFDEWTIYAPNQSGSHFVYTSLQGDGQIIARVVSATSTCSVMIRDSLSDSSKHASMVIDCTFSSPSTWFYATGMGLLAENVVDLEGLPYWIRLDRKGNSFTGYISPTGNHDSWIEIGSAQVSMGIETYIGLTVSSSIRSMMLTSGEGVFDNVTVNPLSSEPIGPDNDWGISGNNMYAVPAGSVGIGTVNPQYKLDIRGTTATDVLVIRGGADLAEPFLITDKKKIPEGALVVIDERNPGKLKLSDRQYDKRVAGIVSGAGGLNPGLTLSQKEIIDNGVQVALTGRVYALANTSNGPIEPGDMLTTSDIPGYAMKATDMNRSFGAVIGKAMSPLKKGQGLVLVLVSLQ